MKYIKKFQTNAEYLEFKRSSDWITPNVSLIEEKVSGNDFNIVFEPFVNTTSLITFTVDGVQYQAEEGMYWAEWCGSEYNTAGFIYEWTENGYGIYTSDYKKYFIFALYADSLVTTGVYLTKTVNWPLPWM